MPDFAVSDHPGVQAQLDRLAQLSPGADVLGLERISRLLARLDHPERALPPVLHVAGTNGKGSTCAFLRAMLSAAGLTVHAYTSPHLCRFNERIRLGGHLIADDALATVLAEVLDASDGIGASFFEVTTAAALLSFARHPADAAIIEVGMGGRLDATNLIAAPIVGGVAALGLDHQRFLGDTIIDIAGEKAGIAKPGMPLVTLDYARDVRARIAEVAAAAGARSIARNQAWRCVAGDGELHYSDADGDVRLPLPAMAGAHQAENAGLAVAMLRHQRVLPVSLAAIAAGITAARWPARLEPLQAGPLTHGHEWIIIDGCHNVDAARAIAAHFAAIGEQPYLIAGILDNKDARGLLSEFAGVASGLTAVPVPGHAHHSTAALAEIGRSLGWESTVAPDVPMALTTMRHRHSKAVSAPTLIMGSLYLAGEVLRLNDQLPE